MAERSTSDIALIGRLLREARSYWPHICSILFLDALSMPIALLTPVPLKIVVDSVLGNEPLPAFLAPWLPDSWTSTSALLAVAVGLLILTAIMTQVRGLGSSLLRAYAGGKLLLDFRTRLFRHAQRLSLGYHDMKGVSDALYRVQYDTTALENVVVHGLITLLVSAVTVVAMLYVTARINLQLALVALIIAPVIVVLTRLYRRPLRDRWRKQKKLDHAAMSVLNESFTALRVVKAFSQEEREELRYAGKASESLSQKLRATLLQGTFDIGATVATTLGTALVLLVGVRAIQAGTMTVGDLIIVMTYIGMLYSPLKTVGNNVASLQSSLASAERAFSLLDERPDVPEKSQAIALKRARGDVRFEGVSFAYSPSGPVLRDVTFDISAGARVGIVGRTGAGKSTLMSLLMRFYDPTSGRILLDGIDVRDFKLTDLRSQFAMVLQDTILFSTSIRENIAYARPGASDEEIVAAARSAMADEFITALPEGYDTLVGDRGMRLSGGERQRVALARAFLRDAPILLLDEPTSAVDVRTEAAIMDVMERLMAGRTTFMVTHRLATLTRTDVVLEVANGRLTVRGNPEHEILSEDSPIALPAGSK